MPTVTLWEDTESRTGNFDAKSPTLGLSWFGHGSDDPDDVDAAIALVVPTGTATTGYTLRTLSRTPLGGLCWKVTATYARDDERQADGEGGATPSDDPPTEPAGTDPLGGEWAFQIGGGTQQIYQSLATRYNVAAAGGAGPDFKRAIGVTKDGVDGIDIGSGRLTFTVTLERQFVTLDYIRTLAELAYTTNDAAFCGWSRGELLFEGVSGQGRYGRIEPSERPVSLTYSFQAGETVSPYTLNADIEFPDVRPFDYVWAYYEPVDVAGPPPRTIQRAVAGYVERVYRETDFRRLRLFSAGA